MDRYLGRLSPYIYSILRIIAAVMYLLHGIQKLIGFPGSSGHVPYASIFGAGGIIELTTGTLIAIGLFATYAAFIASGELAFVYFLFHFPKSFWPIINHGEIVVMLCFFFLYVASRGAGVWSIDSLRGRAGNSTA